MNASEDSLFQLTLDECKQRLNRPFSPLQVVRPCTLGDGVEHWEAEHFRDLLNAWQSSPLSSDDCGLWVPASGAATRMFSFLFTDASSRDALWRDADRLALGSIWKKEVHRKHGIEADSEAAAQVLWDLFEQGQTPKGLVPFHTLDTGQTESAMEAHLRMWHDVVPEGGRVWFTIQESNRARVKDHVAPASQLHKQEIHLQTQDPATDTPMLDKKGEWMRDEDGTVLKRPGGHGSLLPLLEDVDTPFLVIRNIDNAPSPSFTEERLKWTKAMLAEARIWSEQRAEWRKRLERKTAFPQDILAWLNQSGAGLSKTPTIEGCRDLLSRPMRLVGVVRNEGQPGGGPFWVLVDEGLDEGCVKPQIVEAVEFADSTRSLLAEATHFNPVDMVCILDPGQSLSPFVDNSRFLRSVKTVNGSDALVLEHPGLWNGSMSGWLTRFVEMPAPCFQPVKSARDLVDRQ